jgi:hypothetical protein
MDRGTDALDTGVGALIGGFVAQHYGTVFLFRGTAVVVAADLVLFVAIQVVLWRCDRTRVVSSAAGAAGTTPSVKNESETEMSAYGKLTDGVDASPRASDDFGTGPAAGAAKAAVQA